MWVYDLETLAFLAVNSSALIDYGYSRDEFLSMTIQDIHLSEDQPLLMETVRSIPIKRRRVGVWKQRKKDGTLGANAMGVVNALLVPWLAMGFGWTVAIASAAVFALIGIGLMLLVRADCPIE